MKEISVKIGDLFQAIEELENHKFKKYEEYQPKHKIRIKNENGIFCDIPTMIKKDDLITVIYFSDGFVLSCGYHHKLILDKTFKFEIYAKDVKIGDKFYTCDDKKVVVEKIKKTYKKSDVFDLEINSLNHIYQTQNGLLHHNSAGVGKSHAVIEEIESEIKTLREEKNKILRYEHISGGIKDAASFYTTLCDHNDENLIVILDDVNTIFTNKDCREILRVATTNEPVRKITYASNRIVRGKTFYRPRTDFYSKIIIVTNIPKKKIDRGILSRTSPIEIDADLEQIYDWVGQNLKDAPPHDMPLKWKERVYNFIKDEIGLDDLKQFDFRVFEDAMLWYGSCVDKKGTDDRGDPKIVVHDDWKSYVYTLCT